MDPEAMMRALIVAGARVAHARDALLFDGTFQVIDGVAEQSFLSALSHLRICAATLHRATTHFDLSTIAATRRSELLEETKHATAAAVAADDAAVSGPDPAPIGASDPPAPPGSLSDRLRALARHIEKIRVDVIFGIDPIGSSRLENSRTSTHPQERAHLDLEVAVGHLELAQCAMKAAAHACAPPRG